MVCCSLEVYSDRLLIAAGWEDMESYTMKYSLTSKLSRHGSVFNYIFTFKVNVRNCLFSAQDKANLLMNLNLGVRDEVEY